jgi:hypothetical protein
VENHPSPYVNAGTLRRHKPINHGISPLIISRKINGQSRARKLLHKEKAKQRLWWFGIFLSCLSSLSVPVLLLASSPTWSQVPGSDETGFPVSELSSIRSTPTTLQSYGFVLSIRCRDTIVERQSSEPSMSDRGELLKVTGDKRLTVRCS